MHPTRPTKPPEVETFDNAVLVTIGESHFNGMNAEAIARHLYGLAQPPVAGRLLVSLKNVRYLTGTLLAGLLTLQRLVEAAGGRLALLEVSPFLYKMLEATCLNQVFEVHRQGEPG